MYIRVRTKSEQATNAGFIRRNPIYATNDNENGIVSVAHVSKNELN